RPRTAAALLLTPLALAYFRVAWTMPAMHPGTVWLAMALTGLAAVCMVFLPKVPAVIPSLIVIVLVFWGPSFDSSLFMPLSHSYARSFDRIMEIQNALKSGVPADRQVRFWYDRDEPDSSLFNAACALYLWGYYDFTRELPAATPDTLRGYVSGET